MCYFFIFYFFHDPPIRGMDFSHSVLVQRFLHYIRAVVILLNFLTNFDFPLKCLLLMIEHHKMMCNFMFTGCIHVYVLASLTALTNCKALPEKNMFFFVRRSAVNKQKPWKMLTIKCCWLHFEVFRLFNPLSNLFWWANKLAMIKFLKELSFSNGWLKLFFSFHREKMAIEISGKKFHFCWCRIY